MSDLELPSSSDNDRDLLSIQEQCNPKQQKKPTFKAVPAASLKPNVFEEQLKQLQQQQQKLQNIGFGTSNIQQTAFTQQQSVVQPVNAQNQDLVLRINALEAENKQLIEDMASKLPATANPELSKKFVDLNAKNRQLTSAIEVLKAKNNAQQQIVANWKGEIDRLNQVMDKLEGKPIKTDIKDHKPDENEVIKGKQQEIDNMMQKYGEQSVKISTLTTENNKLRLFLKKEAGLDWEELQRQESWKGRNQKLVDAQLKISQLNEMISEMQVQLQGGKSKNQLFTETRDEKLFRQQADQLQMFDNAVNELKQQNLVQKEELDKLNDKSSRQIARIAGLETANNQQKGHLQKLVMKSKLDDELINDFRVYIKTNKIVDRAYVDEMYNLKLENKSLQLKLQNSLNLLNTKQGGTNLELILAGCQLELSEKQEMIEKLRIEIKGVYNRLIEVSDRRFKIAQEAQGMDLSNVVKEMQTFYRSLQLVSNQLIDQQQKLLLQFQQQLMEQGMQCMDQQVVDSTTQQMQMVQTSEQLYDQMAKQQLAEKPRKRIAKATVVTGDPPDILKNQSNQNRIPSAGFAKYQQDSIKRAPKPLNRQDGEDNFEIQGDDDYQSTDIGNPNIPNDY